MSISAIIEAFLALSKWELCATVLGITYIILAAKESIWCWPAAFLSTLIYTVLFWEGQLPMQSILNFYYMGMAVYGFQLWRKNQTQELSFRIKKLSFNQHLIYIFGAGLLSVAIGSFTATTVSQYPYLDSAIMIFSVINTYLMAQKVLDNWIYWLFINTAAIYLYWQTGFYVTIVMFCIYFILAIFGFFEWKESRKKQKLAAIMKTS